MSLNACLRLTHYLEHNQAFPRTEELLPRMLAEAQAHRLNLEALTDDDGESEVAWGWKRSFLYRERLGLSTDDYNLVVHAPAAPAAPHSFSSAWRNYIKQVFTKGFMYRLSINPAVTFYVSENKTLAGREDRGYAGEATGRKLVVSFFETLHGALVRRVHRSGDSLHPQLLTIAEILQACGLLLPPDPDRSSAAAELVLEARYQDLDIQRFKCQFDECAPEVHTYRLSGEVLAEAAMTAEQKEGQRTKMMLARTLQRHGALMPGETLQSTYALPLQTLVARAGPLPPRPA